MKQEESQTNQKVIKDFAFLMDLQPTFISRRTAKYIMQQGYGEALCQLMKTYFFDAFYSFFLYDYQGRLLEKNTGFVKISSDKNEKLKHQIFTMKLKEKAWFNICDQQIHLSTSINQIITMDGSVTYDPSSFLDNDIDKRTGLHYQVCLEMIEYRNGEGIEMKRKVYEQQKCKAKQLFALKKYYQAIKIYLFLIHITEGQSKKKFLPNQKSQLQAMNINVKFNLLVCFFKLGQHNQKQFEIVAKAVKDFLLEKQPENAKSHHLEARWLLRQNLLNYALDSAQKANKMEKNACTVELIEEIKMRIKNRGKVRQLKQND